MDLYTLMTPCVGQQLWQKFCKVMLSFQCNFWKSSFCLLLCTPHADYIGCMIISKQLIIKRIIKFSTNNFQFWQISSFQQQKSDEPNSSRPSNSPFDLQLRQSRWKLLNALQYQTNNLELYTILSQLGILIAPVKATRQIF